MESASCLGDNCHGHVLPSPRAPSPGMRWGAAALACPGLEQVGRKLVTARRVLKGLSECGAGGPQKKRLQILFPWWSQNRGSQLPATRDGEDWPALGGFQCAHLSGIPSHTTPVPRMHGPALYLPASRPSRPQAPGGVCDVSSCLQGHCGPRPTWSPHNPGVSPYDPLLQRRSLSHTGRCLGGRAIYYPFHLTSHEQSWRRLV